MSRRLTYLGPKVQVQPDRLDQLESTGRFAAEEKHDGHWAEVTTGVDGRIVTIIGRSDKRFEGANVAGLVGLNIGLPSTVLICELEAGTEAATKRNGHLRHRRLWAFDVVQLLGHDTRSLPYEQRRVLLVKACDKCPGDRVAVVRQVTSGFRRFFEEVSTVDGEGLVLKRLGLAYRPHGADGKTDDWIRCKRFRFVDYVVTGIGRSDGGSPNLLVGLYEGGRLSKVATIKNLPEGLEYRSLVGRVVECKGAEVHESGALRHGHYLRTRDDKDPTDCTLEAALRA